MWNVAEFQCEFAEFQFGMLSNYIPNLRERNSPNSSECLELQLSCQTSSLTVHSVVVEAVGGQRSASNGLNRQ